jgi:hypothetical protein
MFARLLLLLLCVTCNSLAQGARKWTDWKIHLELQSIILPEKLAAELLPELSDETTMPAAWPKLQALIQKKEAKVHATCKVSILDLEEAVMSEGERIRYPIEWREPHLIEKRAAQNRAAAKNDFKPVETPAGPSSIAIPPSEFVTEHLGLELKSEVSLVQAEEQLIRLDLAVSSSRLKSWDEFEIARAATGEKLTVKQPRVHMSSHKGVYLLSNNERVVVCAHRIPGDKEEMEILVLRAWTTLRKGRAK